MNMNKTAIITGASRGIGKATALQLSQKGYQVALAARSENKLKEVQDEILKQGGKAIYKACDLSSYQEVEDLINFTKSEFNSIDVLVNNAGLIDPISRISESDPETWSKVIDLNLKTPYYMAKAVIPIMLKQGGGTIVNMSSGAARSALEGWSHYCTSKAALYSLTRCIHKEYGELGIRVLGLSPGTVATDMMRSIKDSGLNPVSKLDWETHLAPESVAKAISYLCTEASNDFLGEDFSLKTNEGRARVGLEPIKV
ncbi:MAG: SDR family oxidoreductase [Candidatus Caenarcaniphilales bacterium]|nr:SDR family oxidoreductase [Candidatus Caenarcaniphilales bacterium]